MLTLLGAGQGTNGAAFNPESITGLQQWFKVDSGVLNSGNPATNGQAVTDWTRSSTLGVNGTGSNLVYNTNQINGLGAVTFNTSSLILTGISISSGEFTFIFVCNPTDVSGTGKFIFDSQTGRFAAGIVSDTTDIMGIYSGNSWRKVGTPTTGWQVLTFRCVVGTNTSTIFKNGVSQGNMTYFATAIGGNTRIGSINNSTGSGFIGQMAEVLIYNSALSTGDRNSVETYLGTKYGIGIS